MRVRLLVLSAATAWIAAAAPNFVFILADDQAWNGLSKRMIPHLPESGSDYHRTPNIDRLASQGMTFSRAYAAAPKCEPSRYAITFGLTTASLNAPDKRTAARHSAQPGHSLANALKGAEPSYRTATFGKWQLFQTQAELGFDRDDGRITHNQDGQSTDPGDPKRMFELTRKGNRFMEESVAEGRPFYLQLWHYAVHGANQSLPETLQAWRGRPRGRLHRDPTRAAMADDFDRAVGMTLGRIEELGIRDSTYVVYMSDNGGPTRYLRGGKTNVTEGGLRVPLIVRGPGVEKGSHCDAPVVAYDMLPTVLDFARPGSELPPRVEGGSWKPLLLSSCAGEVKRPIDRMVFFFEDGRGSEPGPQAALIAGNHKLLYSWPESRASLYDVAADPRERRDLADANNALAGEMQQALMSHIRARIGQEAFDSIGTRLPADRAGRRERGRARPRSRPDRQRRPARTRAP